MTRSLGRLDRDRLDTRVGRPPTGIWTATDGYLHTPVAGVFDLADAQQAYVEFSQRRGRGRTVLNSLNNPWL